MRIYRKARYIGEGRSFHVFRVDSGQREEPTHTHDFIELVYVLSGSASEVIDGKSYEVGRGDLLFLNSGSTHSFTVAEKMSYVNICFSPEESDGAPLSAEHVTALLSLNVFDEMRREETTGMISFTGEERRAVDGLMLSLLKEYGEKQLGWQTVCASYIGILLAWMLRKTGSREERSVTDVTWEEIATYITDHLSESVSLNALAERFFYNPSYLSRAFKERFGMGYSEYVCRCRLTRAKSLLTDTSMTVEKIGWACGFADRRSLCHAFSKYEGESPSAYRAKWKKVKKCDNKDGKR